MMYIMSVTFMLVSCLAGGWRNALVFDPLAKYDGFSYYDVMLRPVAQALNAVITPDTQVSRAAGIMQLCLLVARVLPMLTT
jgi:hypothetical protein